MVLFCVRVDVVLNHCSELSLVLCLVSAGLDGAHHSLPQQQQQQQQANLAGQLFPSVTGCCKQTNETDEAFLSGGKKKCLAFRGGRARTNEADTLPSQQLANENNTQTNKQNTRKAEN